MVSVQFRKIFTGPRTVDQKTFSAHFLWERPSKYCIVELTVVLVCLLLSWSRRYSMKWSSNLDGSYFNNSWPLYLNFSNMINLCPNIWFIKNSKCQQFFHLKKEPPKKIVFHIFKRLLFRNGQPYWYECWRVLRDFCGLSKKCGFATFPEI